jgi:hypothetical protein
LFRSRFAAIGPAAGSSLLAWSLTSGLPFPLDYHFTFVLMALLSFLPSALSLMLGPEFNAI